MTEKIKVMLQCSSSKQEGGYFKNVGRSVVFVAQPDGHDENGAMHVHPDSIAEFSGKTWRQLILEYNITYRQSDKNPLNLYRAYELYRPKAPYTKIGNDLFHHPNFDFYIISDGWGIVPADFYLPQYNIGFSNSNKSDFFARANGPSFHDIYCLDNSSEQDLVCIAGAKCQYFFEGLTEMYQGKRYTFHYKKSIHKNKYTWVYQCAKALLDNPDLYKDLNRASPL